MTFELTEEQAAIARKALQRIAEGKQCPLCGAIIEKREQVGRSIYLEPCGHRYQGRLTKSEKRS